MFNKSEIEEMDKRITRIIRALACYDPKLYKGDDHLLNAGQLSERLREFEARTEYCPVDGNERKHLTADDILRRFNEIYSFLNVDRMHEPFGSLRKRP